MSRMKNKIQVIDVTIVSTYMGRYLTALVALLVFAITLSAIFSDGGSNAGPLTVAVPSRGDTDYTLRHFEPLRAALERMAGAPVLLEVSGEKWPASCAYLVMSTHEYLRSHESEGLVALYSIEPRGGLRGAVVIAGKSAPAMTAGVRPGDILFTGPHAINGCWLQMQALERDGVVPAPEMDKFAFAPPPGHGERVVYSVASGNYPFGAVAQHILDEMLLDRRVLPGEIDVVLREAPLPEMLLCARRQGDAGANALRPPADSPPPPRPGEARLIAIGDRELSRLGELVAYVEERR